MSPRRSTFADGRPTPHRRHIHDPAVKVISRTSRLQYKGAKKPLPQIARELRVDGVIEGTVQRSNEHVRITVQLIYAATDAHLWAGSYERDFRDVLTLQGEVAQAVAARSRLRWHRGSNEPGLRQRRLA